VARGQFNQKGLTLVEVMLAVSILAIGLVGVLQAYAGSITTLEIGQYSIDANRLLRQKISELQREFVEQGDVTLGAASGEFDGDWSDFLWRWEVLPTDIDDLNELIVIVSHKNRSRAFSVKTYVIGQKKEKDEGVE